MSPIIIILIINIYRFCKMYANLWPQLYRNKVTWNIITCFCCSCVSIVVFSSSVFSVAFTISPLLVYSITYSTYENNKRLNSYILTKICASPQTSVCTDLWYHIQTWAVLLKRFGPVTHGRNWDLRQCKQNVWKHSGVKKLNITTDN